MQWSPFLNVHTAKILYILCSEDCSTLHVTCRLYLKVIVILWFFPSFTIQGISFGLLDLLQPSAGTFPTLVGSNVASIASSALPAKTAPLSAEVAGARNMWPLLLPFLLFPSIMLYHAK